jgi:hypothetical protein
VRAVVVPEDLGVLEELAAFDALFELGAADKNVAFAGLFTASRPAGGVGDRETEPMIALQHLRDKR